MFEHYPKEEYIFVKRCNEWLNNAGLNQKISLTPFLNIREQNIIRSIIGKNQGAIVLFDGGYDNAERKRAIIYPDYLEINPDSKIVCNKVIYNKKYAKLRHKDILGSLLSLQIKRDYIGDIIVDKDNNFYFFCAKEIEQFLKIEFKSISKYPVNIESYNCELENIVDNSIMDEIQVTSMRLDNICAKLINKSRNDIQNIILGGFVQVNWVTIDNVSRCLSIGDTISIRKYGRFRLHNFIRETKNKKKVLSVKKYLSKGRV